VKDNRHWPANTTNQAGATGAAKPGDIAAAYGAKTSDGQPQNLTLEKLRLRFEQNVFFAAPGQGWFKWGPTWARHKSYASLSEFQSDLGIAPDNQALDSGFADLRQLDFRLPPQILARFKDSYPQGQVPGVKLGGL
jgi:hypothetical protein